jgi:hypothetical protein
MIDKSSLELNKGEIPISKRELYYLTSHFGNSYLNPSDEGCFSSVFFCGAGIE